jgi:hypothetical protein
MSRRLLLLFATTAVFALMAIPSWAKNNSNGSLSATIDLNSKAALNNTTLVPGEYRVVVEGNQAKFEKDGKVVAEVPCTLKTLSTKATQTEFVVDHDRLTEIKVSGKTEAIEFSSGQSSGN